MLKKRNVFEHLQLIHPMRVLLIIFFIVAGCAVEVNIMKLTSPAFNNNGKIPSLFTCDGANKSPSLEISDVPSNAKSLVLLMEDPDVPKKIRADGMWDHWIVWNLSPTTKKISEGSEPLGVHGKTTSETMAYVGPCPPDKEHRYFFKLFALDILLNIPQGSTKDNVLAAMKSHVVAEAVLMGKYERGK